MLTPALSNLIEKMNRRADAMDALAEMLFSQARLQRKEIEDLKIQLQLASLGTGDVKILAAAPPLVALLKRGG